MRDFPLALATLRHWRAPSRQPGEPAGGRLSRREVLGLAGMSAAAVSPAGRMLEGALRDRFDLIQEGERWVFRLGGEDRWTLDPHMFGGSPELTVERSARKVLISLTGAVYPGTALPADLNAELRPSLEGWRIQLRMALGGFRASGSFERWLLGLESLESDSDDVIEPVNLSLGHGSRLRIGGRSRAEYLPSGLLRLRGPNVGTLVLPEGRFDSGAVGLTARSKSHPALIEGSPRPRTEIAITRGDERWGLHPNIVSPRDTRLEFAEEPFDRILIEVSEGRTPAALLAEGSGDRLAFRALGGGAVEADPLSFSLSSPRYMRTLAGANSQEALAADFAEPQWVHADGLSLLVGNGPGAEPFEVSTQSGKLHGFRCSPALLATSAPLAGAFVEPAPHPTGTTVTFEPAEGEFSSQALQSTGTNRLQIKNAALLVIMKPERIRVVRPDDMLALDFEFVNLVFQPGAAGPMLVRKNASDAAYLIVHFPPQHIAEEAVPEQGGTLGLLVNLRGGPAPLKSRLSGPSRLAFLVPQSITSIPYTLESLLDWNRFVPSVVSVADPPEAPQLRLQQLGVYVGDLTTIGSASALSKATAADHEMKLLRSIQSRPQARGVGLQGVALSSPNIQLLAPIKMIAAPLATKPAVSAAVGALPVLPFVVTLKTIREPNSWETAIEAPYRIMLSPSPVSAWVHEATVAGATHGDRTELWHTRLAVKRAGKVDEHDDYYRTVRAVWSPDYRSSGPATGRDPFPMILPSAKNRHEIVRATADFLSLKDDLGKPAKPKPVAVERMMLTSLGASLSMRGVWEKMEGLDLAEWTHRAQLGRDHFVKIVEYGYLMPFGHKAVKTTIHERKVSMVGTERMAMLRRRTFITVKEPEREFPGPRQPFDARKMPFKRVEITTLVSPNLDDPGAAQQFFPAAAGQDIQWHVKAVDQTNAVSEFSMPMMFVLSTVAEMQTDAALNAYNAAVERRRGGDLAGQKLSYAPSLVKGDTALETRGMYWQTEKPTGTIRGRAPFYPLMQTAEVNAPALRQIADVGTTPRVTMADQYVRSAFNANGNQGELFVQVTGTPVDLNFTSGGKGQKVGGIAAPNMAVSALSRKYGPVAGSVGAQRAGGVQWDFKPEEFFASNAKLMGALLLKQLIAAGLGRGDGKNVPKLTSREDNYTVTCLLDWNPDVIRLGTLFVPADVRDCLFLHAELQARKPTFKQYTREEIEREQSLNPTKTITSPPKDPPLYKIEGKLKKFEMELFTIIKLRLKEIKFTVQEGKDVDVAPDFESERPVQFLGPLAFVDRLIQSMGGNGTSDSGGGGAPAGRALATREAAGQRSPKLIDFYIVPSFTGIKAGLILNVPTIDSGAFALENISIKAGVNLKWDGNPCLFEFNFCDQGNPFLIKVYFLGGGGFMSLSIALTDGGIESLTAGFQFGAKASFDCTVASGGVYIMAGFTYSYEPKTMTVGGEEVTRKVSTLTGYLQAGGWVNVLGLISCSLELYLGLIYVDGNRLWGVAYIEFTIEILFFSMTVRAEVEKQFAGSPPPEGQSRALPGAAATRSVPGAGSGHFSDQFTEADWREYCLAFV